MGMPSTMSAKAEEIRRVLSEPVVDLWKLRELALTEGGLVNGESIIILSSLYREPSRLSVALAAPCCTFNRPAACQSLIAHSF